MYCAIRLRKPFFFFLIALIVIIPIAHSDLKLNVIQAGQVGADENDEIVLENDETLDVTNNVEPIPKTTETVGGVAVDFTQQVEFVAQNSDIIVLKNIALPTVTVEIPDLTIVKAPFEWNKQISPPKTVSTSGSVPSNFQTPTTSILVGSPDVILVFDQIIVILLEGITGQTAYKLPGEDTWNLIDGCLGTYANPTNPAFPNECSVTDGFDTKILTYHFTEFAELEETPEETPTKSSSGGSSGGGRTGVGPSSTSIPGHVLVPTLPGQEESSGKIPEWFRLVVFWWAEGKITEEEMNNALNWIIANI